MYIPTIASSGNQPDFIECASRKEIYTVEEYSRHKCRDTDNHRSSCRKTEPHTSGILTAYHLCYYLVICQLATASVSQNILRFKSMSAEGKEFHLESEADCDQEIVGIFILDIFNHSPF